MCVCGEPRSGRHVCEFRPQIQVPVKPCGCGVLLGEDCDCAKFAAGAVYAGVAWYGYGQAVSA